MADFIFVALIFALTAIAALFVLACDKVVGPDAAELATRTREAEPARVSSGTRREEVQSA